MISLEFRVCSQQSAIIHQPTVKYRMTLVFIISNPRHRDTKLCFGLQTTVKQDLVGLLLNPGNSPSTGVLNTLPEPGRGCTCTYEGLLCQAKWL